MKKIFLLLFVIFFMSIGSVFAGCYSIVSNYNGQYSVWGVNPTEAKDAVEHSVKYDDEICADTYIIDVRTDAEWQWVGHPGENWDDEGDFLDGRVINISYKKEKNGSFIDNPTFVTDVDDIFGDVKNDVNLILMCRSGAYGRAIKATLDLSTAGYLNVYYMINGFQGGRDTVTGYRTINGWVNDGLPYAYPSSYMGGAYPD